MDVNELNYEMIGKRIRAERIKKGWQQAELAFRSDVTSAHLSHIETGKTKLALPTIVKIANALSVSVGEEFLNKQDGFVIQRHCLQICKIKKKSLVRRPNNKIYRVLLTARRKYFQLSLNIIKYQQLP